MLPDRKSVANSVAKLNPLLVMLFFRSFIITLEPNAAYKNDRFLVDEQTEPGEKRETEEIENITEVQIIN